MKIYAIDTNIILQGLEAIETLYNQENKFVITETILQEIDKFKQGNEDINFNARQFNKLLADSEIIDKNENSITYSTRLGKFTVYKDTTNKTINDDRIIDTISKYFRENKIEFISNDIVFRTKCELLGYKASPFFNSTNSLEFEFNIETSIDEQLLNKEYFKIDELYKLGMETVHPEISWIRLYDITGRPYILIREDETTFKKLQEHKPILGIKPKNTEQKVLLDLLLNPKNDIIISNALAGSGKTLLALIAGIRLFELGKVSSITYIRRTIISGDKLDELGFLKGDLSEKMAGYIQPLRDNIELIIRTKNKKKKKWTKEEMDEAIKEFETQYNINYAYEGHLRGRNLSGYIIIDEAQNDSLSGIRTILSRIMSDSKVAIIGSIEQIDNPYLNKYDNALTFMLNQCGTFNPIQIQGVKMTRTERSNIVKWIEEVM